MNSKIKVVPNVGPELARAVLVLTGWGGKDPRDVKKAVEAGIRDLEKTGKALAALGWVVPMSSSPRETHELFRAKTARQIDAAFVRWYQENRERRFHATLRELTTRQNLEPSLRLIRQAAAAYRRGHFAITVPALLATLEGVMMRTVPGTGVKATVKARVAAREARSPDAFTTALWRTVGEFIEQLYKNVEFSDPRPPTLNRHWILHGRDVVDWDRADSLRLFQAVDTVSSLWD